MPETIGLEASNETVCSVCGRDGMRLDAIDGLPVCYDCARDSGLFARCGVCGVWHMADTMTGNHQLVCASCVERNPMTQRDITSWALLDSQEAIGFELECFPQDGGSLRDVMRRHPELSVFTLHGDGSVRGGEEMVSCPIPLVKLKAFMEKLAWMPRELGVDGSCGTHIHINAKPWLEVEVATMREIGAAFQKLTLGFMKIEQYMFETQPASRRMSHYCKPLRARYQDRRSGRVLTYDEIRHASETNVLRAWYCDSGRSIETKRDIPRDNHNHTRYTWLNLNSLMVKNTVEIRLHAGTVNARKIRLFASAMSKLVKHFMTSTLEEIDAFTVADMKTILSKEEYDHLEARRQLFADRGC